MMVVHDASHGIHFRTVDEPVDDERARRKGTDGIVTNRMDLLSSTIGRDR